MISVADPTSKIRSKFEINKMNKIIDSIGLILQNSSSIADLNLKEDSIHLVYLARELGMGGQMEKIIHELKKVYKN
jgi:hypothetical protein